MTGIEPAFSAWEADVLPLNYTRNENLILLGTVHSLGGQQRQKKTRLLTDWIEFIGIPVRETSHFPVLGTIVGADGSL